MPFSTAVCWQFRQRWPLNFPCENRPFFCSEFLDRWIRTYDLVLCPSQDSFDHIWKWGQNNFLGLADVKNWFFTCGGPHTHNCQFYIKLCKITKPWWLSGLSHIFQIQVERVLGPRFKSLLGIMINIALLEWLPEKFSWDRSFITYPEHACLFYILTSIWVLCAPNAGQNIERRGKKALSELARKY